MSLLVEGVGVQLGGRTILEDVSMELGDNETVAVLGPSGSGKTTLLRVIAGLERPTTGRVVLDGRDVTDVPTHRRGVGIMFQDHALFPHRDVAGNVGFGLKMAGEPRGRISTRVGEVLELVGLAGFEHRSIDNLSGGERQRVALARALAPRPSVLLLDEPLGSLDRALRDRLLDDLIEVLGASGASVIHVTHDQAEAFATGDRILVMRDGRIAQVGEPYEVWRHPVDAGVARIVGPVTLVPVEVRDDGAVIAPWGQVRVDPGDRRGPASLVLRPDSLSTTEAEAPDALVGVVAGRTFRGDHVLARVRIDSGGGHASVEVLVSDRVGAIGAVGDPVTLMLDRSTALVSAAD